MSMEIEWKIQCSITNQNMGRLYARSMLAMRYALRRALVHLLRLNHTALHNNVWQVGEEQNTLIEARAEQCALQLLQYGNANE